MRAVVTGASGTVGSALCRALTGGGHIAIPWRRDQVPTDRYAAMRDWLTATRPDTLFHLAVASSPDSPEESWAVNYEWASELAWLTATLGIRFVFTSTVLVFSFDSQGPYTIGSRPVDAGPGYSGEKAAAEARVRSQNPDARIVRLGWQIGSGVEDGANQMVAWLHSRRARIEASTTWMPACSFLPDTAQALITAAGLPPGLYQADSNRGWSFYDIAHALQQHHSADWNLVATADPIWDQRLLDRRLVLPPLSERLPGLR